MKPATVVDCTGLSPLGGLRVFLRAFDALAPDESLELRHAQDPEPMLKLLQRARPNTFEWHPLERGRELYRVEIVRRKAATPLCPGELLEVEYQWMDEALTEVDWRAERRLWPGAWSRWGACRLWLLRHREMEEPLMKDAIGHDPECAWAVEPMCADHRRVDRLAREVGGRLNAHDATGTHAAIADLREALGLHHQLGRHVLHPRLDAAFGASAEVTGQMQSV